MIELQRKRFEKRAKSFDAHTWFRIEVPEDRAIAIDFHGDPHLDDNGVNWPVLLANIETHKATPGLFGVNIGDVTNNWQGRLAALYAQQDTSVKTARRLIEWYMADSGVRWLVWLLGNHDVWGDGAEVLAQMLRRYGTQKIVCHDWEARFILAFPNGWETKIFTAHNFKGSSQFNPLQGPMKEGIVGQDADLYVCGHLHNSGIFQFENAARGHDQTFIRVRGFKFLDDYARHLGVHEQRSGCSTTVVFDPKAKHLTPFRDVAAGAAYLTLLRNEKGGP